MSELATEHFSQKNEFGLPKGTTKSGTVLDGLSEAMSEEKELTQEEQEVDSTLEVQTEEEATEVDLSEVVDNLVDKVETRDSDSELAELRRQNSILISQLEERRASRDAEISSVEEEKESYIDFSDSRIVDKFREAAEESPEALARMYTAVLSKAEEQAVKRAKSEFTKHSNEASAEQQKRIDEARRVTTNIDNALEEARELGAVEKAIVEQVERFHKEGRVQDSLLYKEFARDRSLIMSSDAIVRRIEKLAKRAVPSNKEGNKNVEGTTSTAASASPTNRSGDIITPRNEETSDAPMFDQIKNAGKKPDELEALFS
jgi:hypothetical protein